MKVLLDTHTLIWFTDGDSKLSLQAKSEIEDLNILLSGKNRHCFYNEKILMNLKALPADKYMVINYETLNKKDHCCPVKVF